MPTFNGTSGNDTLDYSAYNTPPPSEYTPDMQWLILNGLDGNDTIYGSVYNDAIYGGSGDDTLYGNGGHDYLNGGSGDDIMSGGAGDDSLDGGIGQDVLAGGSGDDWISGGDGSDEMSGGTGNDVLIGGEGIDNMLGDAGNDQLFGDVGTDILDGGAGNDVLWGGSGDDRYQFNGSGIDYINDGVSSTGAARTDSVYDNNDRVTVSYASSDVEFYIGGNNLLITSATDTADGVINNAVVIENYFLGGHYLIEILQTADGEYSLPSIFPLAAA